MEVCSDYVIHYQLQLITGCPIWWYSSQAAWHGWLAIHDHDMHKHKQKCTNSSTWVSYYASMPSRHSLCIVSLFHQPKSCSIFTICTGMHKYNALIYTYIVYTYTCIYIHMYIHASVQPPACTYHLMFVAPARLLSNCACTEHLRHVLRGYNCTKLRPGECITLISGSVCSCNRFLCTNTC